MKSALKSFVLTLVILIASQAHAEDLTLLGQRLSTCQNLENDELTIDFGDALKYEAKNLFETDRLSAGLVDNPNCFRVGTEVKVHLKNETIPYLGRVYIKNIKTLTKSQLLANKSLPFSKQAIADFVKGNKSKKYGILDIKIMEKVVETFIDEPNKRLPSCFVSYGDWESFRLKEEGGGEQMIKEIQAGKKTAHMWNGTFNCYKVGVDADIQLIKADKVLKDMGSILPTQLHLIHYSSLNKKHASILGEKLSDLKKRMAEKKDLDGGYTTMVVFDYQKQKPKPLTEQVQ